MSDDQPTIPGAGAGRRRGPASDDVGQLRASINVLGRDLLDVCDVAERAAEQAKTAGASGAANARGLASLTNAHTKHVEQYGAWRTTVEKTLTALVDDDKRRPKGEPNWLVIDDPDRAVELLVDLGDWIGRVWTRYPGGQLPACWAYHPWVVSELLAVWRAWTYAYTGRGADSTRVAEWLDRWRPNAAARISAGVGGCSLIDHRPGGTHVDQPARVPGGAEHLDDVARWWSTSRGSISAPVPTTAALDAERGQR